MTDSEKRYHRRYQFRGSLVMSPLSGNHELPACRHRSSSRLLIPVLA
jgi:hypothetical protein